MDGTPESRLLVSHPEKRVEIAPSYAVRPVKPNDLEALVGMHLQQFPEGFYARLGQKFMRTYFSEYFRSPGAIGLVAQESEGTGVIGYLIGTTDEDVHEHFMHRRAAPALTLAGGSALIRRPLLLGNFLRHRALWYTRRYVSGVKHTRRPSSSPRSGELLYICTKSENRRQGIGAALLRSFVEAAQREQTVRLHLVSEKSNTPAHDFYRHRGWQVISESMTRDERPLVKMELCLGGSTT